MFMSRSVIYCCLSASKMGAQDLAEGYVVLLKHLSETDVGDQDLDNL